MGIGEFTYGFLRALRALRPAAWVELVELASSSLEKRIY